MAISTNQENDVTKIDVKGNLIFWNNKGELMERVPYEVKNASLGEEQILTLETTSQSDSVQLCLYGNRILSSHYIYLS